MSEYRYTYKASAATREFIEMVDEFATERDAQLIRAAAMFYILDGWETYWPFHGMPRWLKPRYWPGEELARVKDVARKVAQL